MLLPYYGKNVMILLWLVASVLLGVGVLFRSESALFLGTALSIWVGILEANEYYRRKSA